MTTFADRILEYIFHLDLAAPLPDGIRVMNPFRENENIYDIAQKFYRKFYSDNNKRHLVLGINPGRFGAGVTGITFTDTKHLRENCGIHINHTETYEPSSVFIYEMIEAFGGIEKFYSRFLLSAVSPLGFTKINERGKEINYNYYDDRKLLNSVYNFIVKNIEKHIEFGVHTDVCFCLGTGKNLDFLRKLNNKHFFFSNIKGLEHPRFVMQYRARQKRAYIEKYLEVLNEIDT